MSMIRTMLDDSSGQPAATNRQTLQPSGRVTPWPLAMALGVGSPRQRPTDWNRPEASCSQAEACRSAVSQARRKSGSPGGRAAPPDGQGFHPAS